MKNKALSVLAAGLVAATLALAVCNDPDAGETGFEGYWTNQDPNTGNITHVQIGVEGELLVVHMWGKCHPTDCDWGEQRIPLSDAADGLLSIAWNPGFKIETQELSVLADGRLKVAGWVHYTDGSGRSDRSYTDYFRR